MRGYRRQRAYPILMPVLTGLILAALVLFQARTVRAAEPIKGIDVSRWQGDVDCAQVKKDGVKFVMLGLGRWRDGVGIPDPLFEYNIRQALAQDIEVGVYLYSEAGNEEEAREEADFVLDQIDGYRISYPVAFDIEDDIHRAMTTKERTDITLAFLEVITEAGYYPMIYASESWLNSSMDLSRLEAYDKWVARWGSTVSFRPLSMWQYSSTGRVKGISGKVDLDYSYKDYTKLIQPRTKAAKRRSRTGWRSDGSRYWYVDEDGEIPKNTFLTIGKKTYYVNSKGYRVSGWKKISKKYYYFNKNGVLQKGFVTVSGKRYYLDPQTGARHGTGWLILDGDKYYLDSDGALLTGFQKIGQKTYYFGPEDGKARFGWQTIAGKTYYFKKSGAMKLNWVKIDGLRYYLGKDGVRVTGWKKIGGRWYYLDPETGAMRTNCQIGQYVIGADGVCTNR